MRPGFETHLAQVGFFSPVHGIVLSFGAKPLCGRRIV